MRRTGSDSSGDALLNPLGRSAEERDHHRPDELLARAGQA